VIGIAIIAIVLDTDRGLVDGLPVATPLRVSSSQPPLALAWQSTCPSPTNPIAKAAVTTGAIAGPTGRCIHAIGITLPVEHW